MAVFPYANEAFANPEPVVLFEDRLADLFGPGFRPIYERAVARCQVEYDRLCAESPSRVIHTDLHPWNIVTNRGRLRRRSFRHRRTTPCREPDRHDTWKHRA